MFAVDWFKDVAPSSMIVVPPRESFWPEPSATGIKGTGKRGHIVADTLLLMIVSMLRKLGNICCGHKMFLTKIRNIFCVPDTKFVSATNVARAGKRGNICVGNNVSATMCPRLPVPLENSPWKIRTLIG